MSNKNSLKAYNDNNVYILGAGFSADAGLPLIKDFTNYLREAGDWLEEQENRIGREEEIEAISKVLEFRLKAASAAFRIPLDVENIEELFSLASAKGGESLKKSMILAIAATLDYAHSTKPILDDAPEDCFRVGRLKSMSEGWIKPKNWRQEKDIGQRNYYSCPDYEYYLGVMSGYFNSEKPESENTIITFNYDTLVEEALDELGFNISYGPEKFIGYREHNKFNKPRIHRKKIKVLKLHGSVNWCDWFEIKKSETPSPERFLNAPKKLTDDFKDFVGVFENYASLRERSFIPLLVPPTWQKFMTGFLPKVWDEAVEAIRTATRIIIIGYSIPHTDQHFKYLMAAGLQENISLRKVLFVNKAFEQNSNENKSKIEERLQNLFRPEHFDLGVVETIPHSLKEFLGSPNAAKRPPSFRQLIGRSLNDSSLKDSDDFLWNGLALGGVIDF